MFSTIVSIASQSETIKIKTVLTNALRRRQSTEGRICRLELGICQFEAGHFISLKGRKL